MMSFYLALLVLTLLFGLVHSITGLLDMDKYQVQLVATPPDGSPDRYCRLALAGMGYYVVCDRTEPDSWTSLNIQAPLTFQGDFDASVTGQVMNLFFRPSAQPLAKVNSYSGVVMVSASARIDPFAPAPIPPARPAPAYVPLLSVVLERAGVVSGESTGWGVDGTDALLLKAEDGTWYDAGGKQFFGDAYCTVKDLTNPAWLAAVTPAGSTTPLTQMLVCDPALDVAAAPPWKFRLVPRGLSSTTSMVLVSHHTRSLCGYSGDYVVCSGGYEFNICCVGSSGETSSLPGGVTTMPWWTYSFRGGVPPPLTGMSPIAIEAWDNVAKRPLRFWKVDPLSGLVMAAYADITQNQLDDMSIFNFKVENPGGDSTAPIAFNTNLYLYSEELKKFCRPSDPGGILICDTDTPPLFSNTLDVIAYTFTFMQYDCPRAEYMCTVPPA